MSADGLQRAENTDVKVGEGRGREVGKERETLR